MCKGSFSWTFKPKDIIFAYMKARFCKSRYFMLKLNHIMNIFNDE